MEIMRPQHKEFADEFLDTGNATKSVQKVYGIEDYSTAGVKGHRLLKNDKIISYLESNADKVASNMVKLALSAESEQVQVSAGKDVLDRAGYKPIDRSEVKNDVIISTLTEEEKENLKNLLNK